MTATQTGLKANLLNDLLKQIVDEYGDEGRLVLPAVEPDPDTTSKVIITGSATSGYTLTMISLSFQEA